MEAHFGNACRLAACAVIWLGVAAVQAQYLPEYPTGDLGSRDEARMRRLYTLYPAPPAGLVPCPNPTSPYGSVMPIRQGMVVTTVNRPVEVQTRFGVWRNDFPSVAGSTMTYSYVTRPNRRILSREMARQGAVLSGPTAYMPQVIAQPAPALAITPNINGSAQPTPTFAPVPTLAPQPAEAAIGPQLQPWTNQPLQPGAGPELIPLPVESGLREF